MASIIFNNVSVDFPIYNVNTRSLKQSLIRTVAGGGLSEDKRGHVIVRALDTISFTFNKGDCVAIIGHNGSGKSTLLRLIAQVYEPSAGEVTISGHTHSLIDIALGINSEATGRENIYLRGMLLGLTKNQIYASIDDVIAFAELGHFIDMPVRSYSSGMNLRLAFAISTMVQSPILIMDEWLSVGDEAFKAKATERLTTLVSSTDILVVATHSESLIRDTCNRVLWLEKGRIKMDDQVDKVVDAYFKHIGHL